MKVSAREIARGRWSLDMDTRTHPCGCTYVLEGDEYTWAERQTRWCWRHDTARDEDGELR